MSKISFQTLMDWVLMRLSMLRPGAQPKDVKLYVFDEINRKKYPVMHAQRVNKHQIFYVTDFKDFSPRKGFKCEAYFGEGEGVKEEREALRMVMAAERR